MTAPHLIAGLGELLWDLFPGGRRLGGAPANFAVLAAELGNHAVILSRVGRDDAGRDALSLLAALPVDASHIQIDPARATGSVSVAIEAGQPGYVIHQPAAWDALEFTSEWQQLAARAEAVCYGTLAQRSEESRRAIQSFLAATFPECVRVFDVNLRPPFYSPEVVEESIEFATVLKMNEQELPVVLELLGLASEPGDLAAEPTPDLLLAGARLLLAEFPLSLVCITCGKRGSLLVNRSEAHLHPGVAARVEDTVGAGDAFTAALTHYYLQSAPLAVLAEAGNRWGAWMASQPGAMPPLDEQTRNTLEAAIARTPRQ